MPVPVTSECLRCVLPVMADGSQTQRATERFTTINAHTSYILLIVSLREEMRKPNKITSK